MKQRGNLFKQLIILFIGYGFLSLGIVLTKRADLGMNAWGIFHQGLAEQLGISFGMVTIFLGLIILAFSVWLLKTKIGIGTILNVLVVGIIIDLFDYLITFVPSTIIEKVNLLLVGLIVMTFGRALYISASLGQGPRDGLIIGLHKVFNLEIKYLKPAIEATVLIIGYFLGGTVGFGTIVIVFSSGYLVQGYFKILHYNPKTAKQTQIFSSTNK